jgi:hypothetical protein
MLQNLYDAIMTVKFEKMTVNSIKADKKSQCCKYLHIEMYSTPMHFAGEIENVDRYKLDIIFLKLLFDLRGDKTKMIYIYLDRNKCAHIFVNLRFKDEENLEAESVYYINEKHKKYPVLFFLPDHMLVDIILNQ